jgi:hypothetical protein
LAGLWRAKKMKRAGGVERRRRVFEKELEDEGTRTSHAVPVGDAPRRLLG